MTDFGLPSDVNGFMDFIGENITASGGLVWEERERIKCDMMLVRHRWAASRVTADALRGKCVAIGMTDDEAAMMVDWLGKAQTNRQLRTRYIKDFKWHEEPE
ncbi:hypothetical protein [Streptomyces sp. t39]|uniref:hypothetical protein n=1 Tax=Streptomyces sp. t39 TaxID=1828156 RepID=UPI0011CEA2D0|nr:hypothetical protein [Streptomyces sp. t39]TXS50138.1 hypothetical protein EAO77_27910 [Streptomyces sp. t39]